VAAMKTGETWIDRFEGLGRLPEDLRRDLVAGSKVVALPAGTQVFAPGQSADNLLLLLAGTIRVQQRSDTGREVFLYRVHAGESCVLTTACMLAFEDYSAEGIAETDVRAVAIPRTNHRGNTMNNTSTGPTIITPKARMSPHFNGGSV